MPPFMSLEEQYERFFISIFRVIRGLLGKS